MLTRRSRTPNSTGPPSDDELKAGEVSLHSDLLLHGSEANHSDRRRCGLTLRYCAADVRAGLGWNEKGVSSAAPTRPATGRTPRGRRATDYFVDRSILSTLTGVHP